MNGQIQYGSARPLTSQPTPLRRGIRLADPHRFGISSGAARPMALLFGSSLLLGGLLTATPREAPAIVVITMIGGAWLSLVLAMSLPSAHERAGQELLRRLAQFRHELQALGDQPTRAALERLLVRARELALRDDEIGDELSEIRACLDAVDMQARLERGDLPQADTLEPLAPDDCCHFVCPVRFGRRRSDQFGHLVFTAGWVKFHGAIDISIAWSEIGAVRRDGREIVLSMHDSRRVLRFSCQSNSEAAVAGVIAQYLTGQTTRLDTPPRNPELHASV